MGYLLILVGLGLLGFAVYYLSRNAQTTTQKGRVSRMNKLAVREDQSVGLLADQQLDRKILSIWEKHDPGMGNVVAWWRQRKLGGQNKFLETANQQQRLLIEQASTMAEALAKRQISEEEFRVFVLRNSAELHMLGQAAQLGMNVQDFSETNKARHLAEIEIEKERQKHKIALDARITEYDQDQATIDRVASSQSILEEQERQRLNKMYEERVALRNSNDPAKADKLRALEAAIQKKESKLYG